jgi:hypothetical protein
LLPEFQAVWDECKEAFRQRRTQRRGQRLALSQLACPGRHTVTGLLYTCGRQFADWSSDYRLFSRDRWDVRELFAPITRGLLDLIPPADPLVVAMDDTLLRKTGTHIPGVGYRRDPLSPAFQVNFVRGQRFLQLSGLLPAGAVPAAARAIPLRFEHVPPVPRPKKSAGEEEKQAYRQRQKAENLSTRGVGLLQQVREELDRRHDASQRWLIAGVDGGYTNKTVLKRLPERTTLIGRVRKDAALFYPVTPEDQAPVGTRRRYGQPAPTPEQLRQDEGVASQEISAFAAGRVHTFRVKTLGPLLWKTAGVQHPLRLVVIAPVGYRLRKNSKLLYRQPAYLICTDVNLPLDLILQYYIWRWGVEVNHRDEKQIIGVGEAQVRAPRSANRQPAFAVAAYAALLLAAARAYGVDADHGTLPLPKWQARQPRQRLSTQELIRELRSEVYAYGIHGLTGHSEDFVTGSHAAAKGSESELSAVSALIYAATG